MNTKYDWDRLVDAVEKIEGDLPDIGFMIEFCKIWIPVREKGDKISVTLDKIIELKKKYRTHLMVHSLSFLKELDSLLEDS